MRPWIALVLAVGGGFTLYLSIGSNWNDRSLPASNGVVNGKPTDSTASLSPSAAGQRSAPSVALPPTPASTANATAWMLDSFKKIVDGRTFVLEAWRHPEVGGVFYAEYVARECRGLSNASEVLSQHQPSPSEIKPEHLLLVAAQLDRLKRLCGQFTPEELDTYALATHATDQVQSHDILFRLSDGLTAARRKGDLQAKSMAIQSILEAGDPLLLDQIGSSLSSSEAGLFFNGHYFSSQEDREVLLTAYSLLPCGLGLPCDDTDLSLALPCTTGGECFDSRQDKVKRRYAESRPDTYERIIAVYGELLKAVQSRNVNAFVPNSGIR